MSLLALLLTQGTLAAVTSVASTQADAPPPPPPAASADAPPPDYPPPPPVYPPPPVVYGPPPIYVRPIYGPPPGYARVYPAPGSAAPPPAAVAAPLRSLPYTHDGFFFRMSVGGGVTSATHHDGAGHNTSVLGGDADITVAAGWSVIQNLELFGALFVSGMDGPEVNGVSMSTAGLSGGFGGFGAGAAYYFEPRNIYVSAAVGGMEFSLEDQNNQTVYGTNLGLGFQAMAGKEWWVQPEWGIGVALDAKTAYLNDKGSGSLPWSVASIGLVLSLTCN